MNVLLVLTACILWAIGVILILFEREIPIGGLVIFIGILIFIIGEQEIR